MSTTKKIVLGIVCFLAFLLLVNFGLNFWLSNKLPKVISDNNDSPYHFTYKELKVDLFPSSNIYLTNLDVTPKIKPKNSSAKIGVYANTKSITITNFSIWHFIFNDIIKAKSITINQPNVILYQKEKDTKNIRKEITKPFEKLILVTDF